MNSKLSRWLTIAVLCWLWIGLPAWSVVSAQESAKDKLDQGIGDEDGWVRVFVRMEDQLLPKGGDYERFCKEQAEDVNRLALRSRVVQTLREKSDRSRNALEEHIANLENAGGLRGVHHYWIVNGFACEATVAACQELANLEEVNFIYRQRNKPLRRPGTPKSSNSKPASQQPELAKIYRKLLKESKEDADQPFTTEGIEIPWNLKCVRADKAWAKHGVTGKGVVIAVLDDGMMAVPALLPALWTNPNEKLNGKDDDGNGCVDDVFGYHFNEQSPFCVVQSGARHGTLCAGVVAARPTEGEKKIATGVAPRAKIMPLIGSAQLSAYEYALENGADILSISSTREPTKMGNYRGVFRAAHEHLAAAGVVSVGGAGNYGTKRPVGKQIGSPKDIPCVIAAAGIRADGKVPQFSSRGPVLWQGTPNYGPDETGNQAKSKPNVTTCIGGYPLWTRPEIWVGKRANKLKEIVLEDDAGYVLAIGPQGNSFSGPHVAGVVALMLEANPGLPVWQVQRMLEDTCQDMGEPGRDLTHGEGMVQADKAVQAALGYHAFSVN